MPSQAASQSQALEHYGAITTVFLKPCGLKGSSSGQLIHTPTPFSADQGQMSYTSCSDIFPTCPEELRQLLTKTVPVPPDLLLRSLHSSISTKAPLLLIYREEGGKG